MPELLGNIQTPNLDETRLEDFEIRVDDYIVIEWPDHHTVRLDSEGRWCTYQTPRQIYRRTVEGNAFRKTGASYQSLEINEEKSLLAAIQARLRSLAGPNLLKTSLIRKPEKRQKFYLCLDRALKRDYESYKRDKQIFDEIYPEPVPILPPDRYRDVVIQPATGCPYGKCNFCIFYQDQRFHILKDDAFEEHINNVLSFFGSSINNRKGVFLGSASALSIPQRILAKRLDTIRSYFPHLKHGVSAFMDPNHMPNREVPDYKLLHNKGLRQVIIGLETGDPELRNRLNKSSNLHELTEAVQRVKEAGLQVGLTVLVGAGGDSWADVQYQSTIDFIHELPLDISDLIYLSPYEGSINETRLKEESQRLQKGLQKITSARIAPYPISLFRYFS